MDLSTLTIREIFAQLTTIEDALHGRAGTTVSPARRRLLELHQDRLCEELHARVPEDQVTAEVPGESPAAGSVPA